jgi:hypothetical protein
MLFLEIIIQHAAKTITLQEVSDEKNDYYSVYFLLFVCNCYSSDV